MTKHIASMLIDCCVRVFIVCFLFCADGFFRYCFLVLSLVNEVYSTRKETIFQRKWKMFERELETVLNTSISAANAQEVGKGMGAKLRSGRCCRDI
jgi:hypothetical protein